MSDPTLQQLGLARRQAAAELEAVEAAEAALQAQLAAATTFTSAKRDNLAAAERALRAGEDEELKQLVLAPLYPKLASLVFAQLPVDSRLRCREVCRGWRAFLADARHWQVLDLSLSSGVALRTHALLRAALERAQGTLRELDVSGWFNEPVGEGEEELEDEELLPVLRANAASLLELRAWRPVHSEERSLTSTEVVEELLAAAPRLRLLECDAYLSRETARGPLPRLVCEPQFAPLRLQTISIDAENVQPPPDVPAMTALAATHSISQYLKRLDICDIRLDSEPALEALVNLSQSQLQYLFMFRCSLSPASLPALTRMLESRSLTVLLIYNNYAPLLVGAAVPAFCAALRASRLVELDLCCMRLWESPENSLAVVAACTGHPTLRAINFQENGLARPRLVAGRAAIEAALATLEASIPEVRLIRYHEEGEEDEEEEEE